jgi:hypothetical protein
MIALVGELGPAGATPFAGFFGSVLKDTVPDGR